MLRIVHSLERVLVLQMLSKQLVTPKVYTQIEEYKN